MAKPALLYDSRFNGARNLGASSAEPGYPVANLVDWRSYTFWRPTSLPANVKIDSANLAYDFGASVENWTGQAATLTWNAGPPTYVTYAATGSGSAMVSPTGLAIDGSKQRYLVVRMRWPGPGVSAQMLVTYRTKGHDRHAANFNKSILDPTGGATGVWAEGVWDMWQLNSPASYPDWKNSTIDQLEIRLVLNSGNSIDVDYVALYPDHSADYLLLWGHDLGTQGISVDLDESIDNITFNNVLKIGEFNVNEYGDRPFAEHFTARQARWWRLTFNGGFASSNPTIAIAAIGSKLELPRGYDLGFDPNAREPRGLVSTSVTGNALGRTITHEEWRQTLETELVSWQWVRDTFKPAWLDHLRDEPFVLQWDRARYPRELALVSSVGGYQAPQRPGEWADLRFEVAGLAS